MRDETMTSPVTILIAEDDDGHAELIQDHLREAGVNNPMRRFRDGQEAWDYLNTVNGGEHRENGKAYLLLLDIRMPRMDGVEVLRRVKESPALRNMPVIMLTTTDDPREVEACYRLGCNCYVTKPIDFTRFSEALRTLGLFVMIVQVARLSEGS